MQEVLYTPKKNDIEKKEIFLFMKHIKQKYDLGLNCDSSSNQNEDYKKLHNFSVESSSSFWSELIKYFKIKTTGEMKPSCTDLGFTSYGWFPNLKLNFAENLLNSEYDNNIALNFVHESGFQKKMSYKELRQKAGSFQKSLLNYIGEGDIVGAFMPNIPETIITMLAASASGAVFTSTSSDFGAAGVIDRFGQSKPKVIVAAVGYDYNGKYYDNMSKILEIAESLECIEKIILVNFLDKKISFPNNDKFILWDDFVSKNEEVLQYTPRKFSDPLYIMYSSGTTGKPKCMLHSVGGTLLQHVKELGLHSDVTKEKNICYFTTCGWMMWNWLVSSLFFGAQITLYEGSPGKPSLKGFFDIIESQKINIFGTSPKFLKVLEDSVKGDEEFKNKKFDTLETLLSTGAPLLPEQFDFIYKNIKSDIQVSSICGGTDILGCFMLGNPILEVKRGQIQCLGLGMDVACFNNEGEAVIDEEGELVCKSSFPSMPLGFLDDKDGLRMNDAYFNKIPGVWHHGDFITITSSGSVSVFGRSDATLNPGGVRIGTAEIYRQTETLDYLEDSLCIGKQVDGDVEIILFVKMRTGINLSVQMILEIKNKIKAGTTPRHIPKNIFKVTDIPYTRSGKKMEMAIGRILNKKPLSNIEAIANPECLKEYENYI